MRIAFLAVSLAVASSHDAFPAASDIKTPAGKSRTAKKALADRAACSSLVLLKEPAGQSASSHRRSRISPWKRSVI
jgi:hypothetical protein